MNNRELKDLVYEQVARIAKAMGSPKRLELLELLAQCEKTVESLARDAGLNVKTTSAHLKELKTARMVAARKEGKYVHYRLAENGVADFLVEMRGFAEERLLELQTALCEFSSDPAQLLPMDRAHIVAKAQRGEIVVIDVRPEEEYLAAHLPYARSLPLPELKKRLAELPRGREIVAYCRGPFCLMSKEAVALLKRRGYRARQLSDGVLEWRRAGMPVVARAD